MLVNLQLKDDINENYFIDFEFAFNCKVTVNDVSVLMGIIDASIEVKMIRGYCGCKLNLL